MKLTRNGFTLIELMIAVAIISIIAAIGGVAFNRQLPEYRLSGDTRAIASSLMLARMKATSTGIQHAIEFDLDANPQRYVLQRGNASSGSTNWTDLPYTRELSSGVKIKSLVDNAFTYNSGTHEIVYNPNGAYDSSGLGQVDLEGGNGEYAIHITPTTGRIQTIKVED